MASFHLAVKAIGRSAGRSATAAAAYRAGVEITDERTGLVHDYTRKQGVEHRSEEHTSELQSLMRISYAVFCLKKKTTQHITNTIEPTIHDTKEIHHKTSSTETN